MAKKPAKHGYAVILSGLAEVEATRREICLHGQHYYEAERSLEPVTIMCEDQAACFETEDQAREVAKIFCLEGRQVFSIVPAARFKRKKKGT